MVPAQGLGLLGKPAGTEGRGIGDELRPTARRHVSRRSLRVKLVKVDCAASTRSSRDFPCRLPLTGTLKAAEFLKSPRTSRTSRGKIDILIGPALDFFDSVRNTRLSCRFTESLFCDGHYGNCGYTL